MKGLTIGWIALLAIAVLLVGCEPATSEDDPGDEESAAVEDDDEAAEESDEEVSELVVRARELAQLRDQIEANPDQLDELLEEAGLTEEELEEELFEISADPEASSAYSAAR